MDSLHSLASPFLKLTVKPDHGGRIEDLIDRRTGKNWLWHPQGYVPGPRSLPIGASFDDHWTGGWEEVFPNDAAGPFQGHDLVDHGELWSQRWNVFESSPAGIKMSHSCVRVPVDVEKTIVLSQDRAAFRLSYLFKSRSHERLPFLFKLHPAIAVEPEDEILLPRSMIEPVDLGFSGIIGKAMRTPFPTAYSRTGERIRVNRIPPPEAMTQEFFYSSDLADGWAGIRNSRTGTELRIQFDVQQTPYVWAFQSYGKWRGHYVLVLEPCTNSVWDLNTALERGTCAALEPGEMREYHFEVSLGRSSGR